jgi:heterodisulfide reductase subunit A
MVAAAKHENITLMTYSEVESLEGYVGNFIVRIRKKAKYVDWNSCVGCGECTEKCPSKVDSEFDAGLSKRKAIYRDFPQAVPNKFVIDADNCIKLTKGKCGLCEQACPSKSIRYDDRDEIVEEKIGAVVVATGFDLFPLEKIGEYGYGKYKDVIDGLQFERILAASGPTGGRVSRPSDGRTPRDVVFIQCVGSRDPECGMPYCSRICCMYTAKQAMLFKHAVPEGQPYIFCMDIRSGGKGYEEFVQRGMEKDGLIYLRGRVSKVYRDGDKIMVWGADMVSGKQVEIPADLVVLATAMVPAQGIKELASRLRISTDEYGFLKEAHLKLQPVETLTSGIFIAGTAQSPKDITDTVAQASAAASKVVALFSAKEYVRSPTIARVDKDVCKGCGICVNACTYSAIELDNLKKVSIVNEALCEGCGACAAVCPSGAMQQKNYTKKQLLDMIGVATEDYDKG